jgi:hypothetical protein
MLRYFHCDGQIIMKFNSDIDIDFANRDTVLKVIQHTPASIIRDSGPVKHNTGIYVTDIPLDPFTSNASIDYKIAESRGYIKLDFLNVSVYSHVKNEDHLIELMNTDPQWEKLYDSDFCSNLIHIGSHYDTLIKMPEAVNSIEKMAMFLAIIRPGKRHLIGKTWNEITKTVWDKIDNGYFFKKAHGYAYSHLVVVHMNLLCEQMNTAQQVS